MDLVAVGPQRGAAGGVFLVWAVVGLLRHVVPAERSGVKSEFRQNPRIVVLWSYLRLIDFCITQPKAQGPSRTSNESKEEEEDSRGRLSGMGSRTPAATRSACQAVRC